MDSEQKNTGQKNQTIKLVLIFGVAIVAIVGLSAFTIVHKLNSTVDEVKDDAKEKIEVVANKTSDEIGKTGETTRVAISASSDAVVKTFQSEEVQSAVNNVAVSIDDGVTYLKSDEGKEKFKGFVSSLRRDSKTTETE